MPQKARPIVDISEGNWLPTPLFAQINEASPDDDSKVTSMEAPNPDSFEVKLAKLCCTNKSPQILRVRLRKTDPVGTALVKLELVQGSRLIASKNVVPSDGFATYELALTQSEISQITDYTDLRLRVTAVMSCNQCCPEGIPAILYATITGCINQTVPLEFRGGNLIVVEWLGTFYDAACDPNGPNQLLFSVILQDPCRADINHTEPSQSFACDPFQVVFAEVTPNQYGWPECHLSPCGDDGTIQITVTP